MIFVKGLEVNHVYHSTKKLGDDMLWDLNKRSYDYIHMVKQVKIKQMNCTSLSLSLPL